MEATVIGLNEVVVQPVDTANTALLLNGTLYNIESNNTREARSQSVSTDTGNEHTIIKTADESLIGTKISEGELAILDNSGEIPVTLARVFYFPVN